MNQLKEAEKNATKLVQDARKSRVERMKDAKVEAEQAVTAYKAEMESHYQANLSMQTGTSGSAGNALEASTANDIAKMNRDFNSRKGEVVDLLVNLVVKVNAVPPAARS